MSESGKIKSKAIVLANTYLRILPTNSFLLRSPNDAGEGYPFDYAQDDFLRIGDPVLVSHYTQDGSFAFVATSSGAQGFVLSKDIGDVDDIFIKRFKKRLVMINSDSYAFLGKNKTKRSSIKLLMGSVLPLNDKKNILIPIRDKNNRVALLELSLDNIGYISKPLAFTRENVSFVLESLINKPYGWGGNLFHRDCARLVRDYFSLFAIHLPLLSSEQALMGDVYDLSSKSVFDKKHDIVRFAIPYESIVSMKGHVAVYLGLFNGEPILLHALWGLRLFDEKEISYRYIIGKSILSSLDLGKKLQGFSDEKSSFAKKVISFSNLSN